MKNIYAPRFLAKKSLNRTKKFGVLVAATDNLGDDIQSLAQINILKNMGITDYIYLEREKLSDYKGMPVNLLMNGWFMHDIKKFPPSEKIHPIFISIHIANEKLVINNKWYWKVHEPIGCRDEYTKELFEKHNIESYLSKCLTLTFERSKEERKGVYLVDINTCSYIPKLPKDFVNSIPSEIVQHIKHDIAEEEYWTDFDFRLKKAYKLLNIYRKAELVITSRLHCALPCRAFDTPVIFVHKAYKENRRFSGLYNELNGSDGSLPFDKIDPQIDYKVIDDVKCRLLKDVAYRIENVM